jgi:pimeloyl-ACP methyl ester carboxylesterase
VWSAGTAEHRMSRDRSASNRWPATRSRSSTRLSAAPPDFLARLYAELSPDGADHYPVVVAKLVEMHAREPTLTQRDLSGVQGRTLVMLGDDDEVTLEHAVALYRGLPDAELAVIPGTSHGLLVEKPALCDTIMLEFLTTEPVQTLAPIRRA